jgi:hypothetical protein
MESFRALKLSILEMGSICTHFIFYRQITISLIDSLFYPHLLRCLLKAVISVLNNVILRVLYPEEEHDGEDGEEDQGLGDDALNHLLPVIHVKDMRVSEKSVI